jgi:hypothetical protein
MRTTDPYLVVTRDAAQKIKNAPISSGEIGMRHNAPDNVYIVDKVEILRQTRVGIVVPPEYRVLQAGERGPVGQWMRQPAPEINQLHLNLLLRPGTCIAFEKFRTLVSGVKDPGASAGLLITHDPDLDEEWRRVGGRELAGWLITRSGVWPMHVDLEPESFGLGQLADQWPVQDLANRSAMVVGLGSIGGIATDALAAYGIGRLELVDPDRFLWHNMVRHVLGPESVGAFKVDAMKRRLAHAWPDADIRPHQLDVVLDAHVIRALAATVDVIVCCADGVAPRRVVSHLARRAGIPAILACVLDDGAIGEVLRLRPGARFGCLLCHRAHLASIGAIDPEADQELDYGTGHTHRPMTAVPPDLHLVGEVAAKTAVATLLEAHHGDHTQILPGDQAVIGLRPGGDLGAPYDVKRAGAVVWSSIQPPRPNCPTCTTS